jgi:YHS domain-containing protein
MKSFIKFFNESADKLEKETEFFSSIEEVLENENYKEIIKLGLFYICEILDRLQDKPNIIWVNALMEITGEDPVIDDTENDIEKIINAWVIWGLEKGHICGTKCDRCDNWNTEYSDSCRGVTTYFCNDCGKYFSKYYEE